MTLRIEIESATVKTRTGQGKRGPFTTREQTGYLHDGAKYPRLIRVRLSENAKAYPPGMYDVDIAQSVFIDKYGSLALGTLVLVEE